MQTDALSAAEDLQQIAQVLVGAVEHARACNDGQPADYIPELASADVQKTSAAVSLVGSNCILAGDADTHRFSLQSAAKLILLAGLLEDRGSDFIFSHVGSEPSGDGFASLAKLDSRGARPANPLINAGAIALCGTLQGPLEERLRFIETWAERLSGAELHVNQRVLASERRTGDRNRSIAHLLKSTGILQNSVDETLETYFALCSLEASVREAAHLASVLAASGVSPKGERIVGPDTATTVVALMATCGMYDESGTYLRTTGLPAKSGVSGVIVAVAVGRAGVAVASPRINQRGGSVRGHLILQELGEKLGWHFARGR
jgi:glutaminase